MNERDENGETPLFYAIRSGKIDAVKVLIDHGANVNAQNSSGTTPLLSAAYLAGEAGREMCTLLIQKGADTEHRNQHGMSYYMLSHWCY